MGLGEVVSASGNRGVFLLYIVNSDKYEVFSILNKDGMEMKRLIPLVIVAACVGGVLGTLITINFLNSSNASYNSISEHQEMMLTNYSPDTTYQVPAGMDFRKAAHSAIASVVHIKTSYGAGNFSVNPLQFYDSPARSSGSGVIISDDGFVVTNNHVIEDATNIEVVMNDNQRFYAKLVGADPSTDLALLKIKGQNLPFVKYGDSDKVTPGEWVLAIGNPFDLNSTVTAGIVSAKARNIGILRDRTNNLQVESFIQTDAAVNPGNSGGALINLNGELIGVNTAIATSTGSYQGYSFAIPVSLVSKVMDDLLEFGSVQRGLLGIQIQDLNARLAEELHVEINQGVLVNRVNNSSAADEAGIHSGDIIIGINDHPVRSVSELQELVARHRPGIEIKVSYLRDGKEVNSHIRLKNYQGNDKMEVKEVQYEFEGALFEDVPYKELNKLGLEGGVRIKNLNQGKWKDAGVREGFILTYIDRIPVENMDDLNKILDFKDGGILVEGFYGSEKSTYGLDW